MYSTFSFGRWVLQLLVRMKVLNWNKEKLDERIDGTEVIETMVYSLSLTGTWRPSYLAITLMHAAGTQEPNQTLAYAAGVCAGILFGFQVCNLPALSLSLRWPPMTFSFTRASPHSLWFPGTVRLQVHPQHVVTHAPGELDARSQVA